MDATADELAGVVDLFGALTHTELGEALAELAFKRGEDYDTEAFDADIEDAIYSYHLVAVPPEQTGVDASEPLLVVGPVAFPELSEGATDLPHILDADQRTVSRAAAAGAAKNRFETDVSDAIQRDDDARIETLLDVSYELEAWGSVEVAEMRNRLDTA